MLITLYALAFNGNSVFAYSARVADTLKTKQVKPANRITDTRKNKPSSQSSRIKLDFIPFKPFNLKDFGSTSASAATVKQAKVIDDKVLNNVKVYPNPVEDEINLSYHISKDSNITIKIMDVLGNEISTLFSQKTSAGDQSNSFNISSRLKSGFYFIRLVAGQETVIKRISVL